ncbi:hypothetical protein OG323_01650 [Streptomyces cyaneofuscatus]|uniref:HEAT repeat domain-containing protein n=1 Tax=Streptomyces cyaneofuscatus TaxID=66883 RepID=UPI00386FF3FF|nr:hypothetical protein OG323_01650 [Streptomyces cyaneofuscatus]
MFEALETLTDRDPDQRDVAAAVLGDLLRGTALDAATARRAVGSLVNLAINEPVTRVRESALNSISEAFSYHSLPLDLVEPLAPALPTMTGELLAHSVYIFGATRDPQARPLIEPFLQHPDADVREEARQAAAEITRPKPDGHIQKS